jgi:hypothetical protein
LPVSQHHGINRIAVGIPVTIIVARKIREEIMRFFPSGQG